MIHNLLWTGGHPNCIPNLGRITLVVDPTIGGCRLSKVLMYEGFGINIPYANTISLMGIALTALRQSPTQSPGVIPGRKVEPLGQITLEVIFGHTQNCRLDLLCFEVVPFQAGGYEAVLGRTTFVKFMAMPCYMYMKLKMLGPHGIIMVYNNPRKQ